jgi:hypothetical protein
LPIANSEDGFHYDADADHYHCPQGERLALHLIDPHERVAVYRASASACADCSAKVRCPPHDEGRHIYRPQAAWTETDVGRFHQGLSLLMAASAAALSLLALLEWAGRPGTGLLLVVFLTASRVAVRDARSVWRSGGAAEDDGPACGQGQASWASPECLALGEGSSPAFGGAGRLLELAAEGLALGLQVAKRSLKGLAAGIRDGLHTFIIGPVQAAAAPPWPRSRDQFQLDALNKYPGRRLSPLGATLVPPVHPAASFPRTRCSGHCQRSQSRQPPNRHIRQIRSTLQFSPTEKELEDHPENLYDRT